jgi:hypothetical protein
MPGRVPGFRFPIAFSLKGMAEKVLEKPKWPESWPYNDLQDFAVQDPSADEIFYDQARLVYHIDDSAVSALTAKYSEYLNDGDDVLDLCSSWVSHYPKDFKGGKVVGLGMNAYELKQNPQLTDYAVQNLNSDPKFPFEDASFDKVRKSVFVQQIRLTFGRICVFSDTYPDLVHLLNEYYRCLPKGDLRCFH